MAPGFAPRLAPEYPNAGAIYHPPSLESCGATGVMIRCDRQGPILEEHQGR